MSRAGEDLQDASLAAPQVELLNTQAAESKNQNGMAQRQRSTSLRQMRSQNGYGCNEAPLGDVEQGAAREVKEQEKLDFEVVWEDGDRDPLNPRSWSKAWKWFIVMLCSITSGCVYVVADAQLGSLFG